MIAYHFDIASYAPIPAGAAKAPFDIGESGLRPVYNSGPRGRGDIGAVHKGGGLIREETDGSVAGN